MTDSNETEQGQTEGKSPIATPRKPSTRRPRKPRAEASEAQADTAVPAVVAPSEAPAKEAAIVAQSDGSERKNPARGPRRNRSETPKPPKTEAQRELLFSSDDEDNNRPVESSPELQPSSGPMDRNDAGSEESRERNHPQQREERSQSESPADAGSRDQGQPQQQRNQNQGQGQGRDRGDHGGRPDRQGFQRQGGGHQGRDFRPRFDNRNDHQGRHDGGNRGPQHSNNPQMQNKKKNLPPWKNKVVDKKPRRERFNIDGLNAEVDDQLDLGNLTGLQALQTLEGIQSLMEPAPIAAEEGSHASAESTTIEAAHTEVASAEAASVSTEALDLSEIYNMPLEALRAVVHQFSPDIPSGSNRKTLIEALLKHAFSNRRVITVRGVLEILGDGNGLLTYSSDSYRIRALSAFVPAFFIRKLALKRGHDILARIIPAVEDSTCPLVTGIIEVQGTTAEQAGQIIPFTEQIPYYPLRRILLECDKQEESNKVSMRVVDLISPIGFGQRGLIVAPPRTGKTVLLQGMANSIQTNYPDAHLIVLLIDERPEEVTDFRRRVKGEVVSSTFDESAESHVHAAEMVIEKSRRMVEAGKDVVILLDSITRLARAYNTVMPSSGKILSGGVEANALQKPKRFFGSARNIEGGGSLTIIATALVETGSKMDEVIFEEFKGTGNMELHLDRALVDKRIFPALSMEKSGTRKEELLYHPDELNKVYSLRRAMKGVPSTDAMEMLISKVKKTGTNAEFLMTVNR